MSDSELKIWFWRYVPLFFKVYFSDYAIRVFPISPSLSSSSLYPQPSSIPHLSSCPRVVHVSSLSPLFPIPFLTSPYLFYANQLCFFFPLPFPSIPPFPLPTEISPCDVHFSDSVPVLVVCLVFVFVFFYFILFFDSCEFVFIFLFIVLDLFLYLK